LFPTSFQAVTASGDRVYLLTSTQGVAELANGSWFRRTFGWPRGSSARTLAVDGDIAIIGTADAGVLLWDLAANQRRVALMRPR
jgi:hypothetical protein